MFDVSFERTLWRDYCSLHAVTSSVSLCTVTGMEKCNLFILYYNENSNGLLKIVQGIWDMGHDVYLTSFTRVSIL